MKHQLVRVLGKQEWAVGSFDTHEEAAEYAVKYVEQTGDLWRPGTRFAVKTSQCIGLLVDGKLVPTSKIGFLCYEGT